MTTIHTPEEVQSRIELFVSKVQAYSDAYMVRMGFTRILRPIIGIVPGRKSVKIVREEFDANGVKVSGSVYCFIDKSTGDILRAASYKAPAPNGKRGNIFQDDECGVGTACNEYGCVNLR
jgi:hypothetical protein